MAALVCGEFVLPISTGVVTPIRSGFNKQQLNHRIKCGRTMDYHMKGARDQTEFTAITLDGHGRLVNQVIMDFAHNMIGKYDIYCTEFRGEPHMLALYADNRYSVINRRGIMASASRNTKPWIAERSAEGDDGKLYFASYYCGDFSIPGIDEWCALDFIVPEMGRVESMQTLSTTICAGVHGEFYHVTMSAVENGRRCLVMRDPRAPKASYMDHELYVITNVDGMLYVKASGGMGTVVSVCIYDERANAMIGTTALVNANSAGICRLNPKKYN